MRRGRTWFSVDLAGSRSVQLALVSGWRERRGVEGTPNSHTHPSYPKLPVADANRCRGWSSYCLKPCPHLLLPGRFLLLGAAGNPQATGKNSLPVWHLDLTDD